MRLLIIVWTYIFVGFCCRNVCPIHVYSATILQMSAKPFAEEPVFFSLQAFEFWAAGMFDLQFSFVGADEPVLPENPDGPLVQGGLVPRNVDRVFEAAGDPNEDLLANLLNGEA